MRPPAYSSSSGCELSPGSSFGCIGLSGSLFCVSVIAHLSLVEPHRRLIGPDKSAREHAPDEDAERTEAHHQGGQVRSDDLEIGNHGSFFLCRIGGTRCSRSSTFSDRRAGCRSPPSRAGSEWFLRGVRLQLGIVERRAVLG